MLSIASIIDTSMLWPTPSSSAAHRPSFGRGWTARSYPNEVSPDLSTLRTLQVTCDLLDRLALDEVLTPYPRNRLNTYSG
jgi:hypothetical protein